MKSPLEKCPGSPGRLADQVRDKYETYSFLYSPNFCAWPRHYWRSKDVFRSESFSLFVIGTRKGSKGEVYGEGAGSGARNATDAGAWEGGRKGEGTRMIL